MAVFHTGMAENWLVVLVVFIYINDLYLRMAENCQKTVVLTVVFKFGEYVAKTAGNRARRPDFAF